MKLYALAGLTALALAGTAQAQGVKVDPAIGSYQKIDQELAGDLNAVGSDTMLNLFGIWKERFATFYPGVHVQVEGKGSSTAPPALIKGTAQFGPMSRAMKEKEIDDFVKEFGYKPTQIRTSMDALAVFVHKDNPIKGLTLQEVDAIFSKTKKLGAVRDIQTWDKIGWNEPAISLYGRNSASGTYGFFKKAALGKGDFKDTVKEQPGSSAVVQAIGSDLFGMGYSGIGYKTSAVRALPLGKKAGEYYQATLENVVSRKYPLGRFLYLYINKAPNKELDVVQREFLNFVLSKEGQEGVIKAGYLPMPAKVLEKQRAELGLPPTRTMAPVANASSHPGS